MPGMTVVPKGIYKWCGLRKVFYQNKKSDWPPYRRKKRAVRATQILWKFKWYLWLLSCDFDRRGFFLFFLRKRRMEDLPVWRGLSWSTESFSVSFFYEGTHTRIAKWVCFLSTRPCLMRTNSLSEKTQLIDVCAQTSVLWVSLEILCFFKKTGPKFYSIADQKLIACDKSQSKVSHIQLC